jgi:predicted nucleic-acid-binding Zn-ribbon protein
MNNGLCPECGCQMIETHDEKWTGDWETVLYVEITYTCPSCEYVDTTYDSD